MLIGKYIAQYTGRTMCGFINSHEYIINIDKDIYGYQVTGIKDITTDEDDTGYITYASETSLKRNWDIKHDI